MTHDHEERLIELLSDEATIGLAVEDEQELKALLSEDTTWHPDSMHLAVAAADLAIGFEQHVMPVALRQKIEADAAKHFGFAAAGKHQGNGTTTEPFASPVIDLESRLSRTRMLSTMGWLAAAACLVLAFLGWNRSDNDSPITPEVESPTVAEARNDLIENSGDFTQWDWNVLDDPTSQNGVAGDVVWSSSRQQGYMRISGLKPSDGSFIYQLWIFDKSRKAEHPVDGGVFDVSAAGEVIVPIDAKLAVRDLDFFAITVEPPGGVVVSERERIVLTAAPKG